MGYFGCHLTVSGGYLATVERALSIGANTFAFFTRNPRGSRARAEDPEDARLAARELEAHGFGPLVAHGAYTMNLCTQDPQDRAFARQLLTDDLRRVSSIPGQLYNFHPGSHVGQGEEKGIEQVAQGLREALSHRYPVTVLLETMAGKGTELGASFWQLRQILDAVGDDSLGVCLDTCHIHDAGYDLAGDAQGVLEAFDRIIGLSRLKALHLNDSKFPVGSRKDRHELLGQGKLGLQTFRTLVNLPALKGLPMILETPNDLAGYRWELELLRSMEQA